LWCGGRKRGREEEKKRRSEQVKKRRKGNRAKVSLSRIQILIK